MIGIPLRREFVGLPSEQLVRSTLSSQVVTIAFEESNGTGSLIEQLSTAALSDHVGAGRAFCRHRPEPIFGAHSALWLVPPRGKFA